MLRKTPFTVALLVCAAAAFGGSTPEVPPLPAVLMASEAEVKKAVEDLEKAFTDKDDELVATALENIETLKHESFVPYVRKGLKWPAADVQAAAIRAAASQEMKDIEKEMRALLKKKPTKKDPTGLAGAVGSAVVDYLVRLDVPGEEAVVLDEFLTPLFADERRMKASWARDLVRASVHYFGKSKYKRAVPLLVEMVPEPQPKNPNDPKNPPSSYWAERVKLWHASESWVRWALRETTGKEFRSYREWDAWLKENRKDYR